MRRCTATLLTILAAGLAAGAEPATPHVFDGDVRDLPRPRLWRPGDPVRSVPQRFYDAPRLPMPNRPGPVDPLLAPSSTVRSVTDGATTPSRNVEGLPYTGLGVPDSVGDVGPNHYIHSVNGFDGNSQGATVRIYDKASPVPNELATFDMRSLGTGSCTSPFGDPVVLYDRPADRWLLAETAGSTFCVYVSQTGDPVAGGWYAYQFNAPGLLADYPKLAVWPTDVNAGAGTYVTTTNEHPEAAIYALDRGAMLAGLPVTQQRFVVAGLPAFNHQDVLPAHPVGPSSPPTGAVVPLLRHRDTELHGGSAAGDLLELWELSVDWITPANSTLTPTAGVDVADFDSTPCEPTSLMCFEQPDAGILIHPLDEPPLYRLNYVNRGGFESIVGTFTVDADGQDHGGLRWFELRRGGASAWTLYDEGTHAAPPENRWMASIGVDHRGNLALGYNQTSAATYPSLLYTGRRSFDPPGVMTLPETVLGVGTAVSDTNRYGDYSLMALDPDDDCTFWFTGEYSEAGLWRTRIATFKFDSCGCSGRPSAPSSSAVTVDDNLVEISWSDVPEAGATEYLVQRSRRSGGPYTTIATVADSSPGVGAGPGYTYHDTTVSGDLTYHYVVLAANGTCPSVPSTESSVLTTGGCLLPPSFAGLTSASSTTFQTCRVDLAWAPATSCVGTSIYDVYRSTDPGFTPGPAELLVGGLTGTAAVDVSDLQNGLDYTYIVRARDSGTGVEDDNLVRRTVHVAGPGDGTHEFFADDFESAGSFTAWTVTNGAGHRCGEWARSDDALQRPATATGFYARALSENCGPLPRTSTTLDSPVLDLNAAGLVSATLELDLFYEYLDGDDASIEVWDGATWQLVWSDPDATVNTALSLDVSAHAIGNPVFQVRFNYLDAINDRWFSIDNVRVVTEVDAPCTESTAPPPIASGSLLASRVDAVGSAVSVSFDAVTCPAATYDLLFGALGSVSTYALAGATCGVGSPFAWSGVPAGDVYFLVIGSDDVATESSWGSSSTGERNGLDASNLCGSMFKDLAGSCPP